eukprot:227689-Chlamydomonas_euryale.AAC.1
MRFHTAAAPPPSLEARSIPLVTVEKVLAWLKPTIPVAEQSALLTHIQAVVPDSLLLQLLCNWLRPSGPSCGSDGGAEAG